MSLQLTFNSVGAMEAFKDRMERMKRAFVPEGAPALKPVDLLAKLLQIAEAHIASQSVPVYPSSSAAPATVNQHFLPCGGKSCPTLPFVHVT